MDERTMTIQRVLDQERQFYKVTVKLLGPYYFDKCKKEKR